jgi:hypothetical protein
MDLAKIASDTKTWQDGDWVDLGAIEPMFQDPSGDPEKNVWVQVRSIRSNQFQRAMARCRRSLDRMQARGVPIDPVKSSEATRTALAEGALLGWKNLTEGDRELVFSSQEAKRVMIEPSYWRFADAVATAATQVGERDAEWREDHLPNSSGGSGRN